MRSTAPIAQSAAKMLAMAGYLSVRPVCVGLAAALLLAACGGGADDTDAIGGAGTGSDSGASDTGAQNDANSADAAHTAQPRFGMVAVPAGSFFMGCNAALDSACRDDELPQREVTLDAYQIDAKEVTNELFAQFLNEHDGGSNVCTIVDCYNFDDEDSQITKQDDQWLPAPGGAPFPAAEVTWFGAREFCTWAEKRLCTEAEWEKAARGGCELYADCAAETPTFPWGDDPWTCDLAVGEGCGVKKAQQSGSKLFGRSPYGVYDMAGNVWEWTADIYHAEYYSLGPSSNPKGADLGDFRVVRGGSFASSEGLRSAHRGAFAFPYVSASTIGLRCCADL